MDQGAPPPTQTLHNLVNAQKEGEAAGMVSVCSANPWVLEACMQQALRDGSFLLVESTSNQVNQFGGYTGLDPGGFAAYLRSTASRSGLPWERIILGGDHLGPSPWSIEPAEAAMDKASRLVEAAARAGYAKLHLDASMRLGGDDLLTPLDPHTAAERTAQLCQAAEDAAASSGLPWRPVYVIGTEVPPPGGALEKESTLQVTRVDDARLTLEITRQAFTRRGLESAWERVIAQVVQPGVEYGDNFILPYDPERAKELSRWVESVPRIVFEAHSTDYQAEDSLRALVRDHFAILKVGPALTFALREVIFSLEAMERLYLPAQDASLVAETLEQAMLDDPRYWQKYYHGSPLEVALKRKFSYSDRLRYYWPRPDVQAALSRLVQRLEAQPPPLTLVSQYLPLQYRHIRQGRIANSPTALIYDGIREVLSGYTRACWLGIP